MLAAREARLMPENEEWFSSVLGNIPSEEVRLGGGAYLTVQRDDVPAAHVEAVLRRHTEVVEIRGRVMSC
jgi:hypothetical protein